MKRIVALITMTGSLGLLGGTAVAAPPMLKIGPHQLFDGFVNHHRPTATILMACLGPIRPGQTGHPLRGQSLSVQPSVDVPGGYTGSAANHITAYVITPVAVANPGVTFRHYGTKALPTTFTLPCAGKGEVDFVPPPTSPTARSDVIQVTFVGQP
jgi:hypothetical protein